jgi:hypothetical protein
LIVLPSRSSIVEVRIPLVASWTAPGVNPSTSKAVKVLLEVVNGNIEDRATRSIPINKDLHPSIVGQSPFGKVGHRSIRWFHGEKSFVPGSSGGRDVTDGNHRKDMPNAHKRSSARLHSC